MTLWQKPKLHEDPHKHRKVSWLELFFDLVFVVVISELVHLLSSQISVDRLWRPEKSTGSSWLTIDLTQVCGPVHWPTGRPDARAPMRMCQMFRGAGRLAGSPGGPTVPNHRPGAACPERLIKLFP